MTTDAQIDPRKKFAPHSLPWLLAAAAFVVYLLTLNHWVSLFNLGAVARTSGWTWQPDFYNPVSLAVTYPFRWLPVSWIPLALNLFSAACGALTIGLLARSVAILPHDRTDAQRKRENSPFSILTTRHAWLPPVFAAVTCGLQLTFWEDATNYTGGMISLLMFAFVIWSLLEYRLDEREGRLYLAALVYGAGMTNDWAMVCFFPVFISTLFWIRGLSFFHFRFIERMTLCGLLGLLFYLMQPAAVVLSGKVPLTFWDTLRLNLGMQFSVVKSFFLVGGVRSTLAILSLSSLAPLLMMAIRWHSTFGDTSRTGRMLTTQMFHLFHAIFLIVCVWVAFDPPFSPRAKGFGLTLYYLSALGVGYYSGYFLLVFRRETKELTARFRRGSSRSNFMNALAISVVCLLLVFSVAGLFYKNTSVVTEANGNTFKRYASLLAECLPHTGGILLSDDPRYLYLAEAALTRDRRATNFVFLESSSLVWPAYHKIVHKEYPARFPDTVDASETNSISRLHIFRLLGMLAQTNDIYYLQPSFGYYFEQFYLEPHGLVYKLNTLPTDTLLPPPPDKSLIAENEAFWALAELKAFPSIERAVAPSAPEASLSWGKQILHNLRAGQARNINAIIAGAYYSRGLNFWGVKLQRAGNLVVAANHFETAQKLNPENAVAKINLQFNHSLQKGEHVRVDLSNVSLDQFGEHTSWSRLLETDGPFDQPSYCFANGLVWVRNGFFRQAMALFDRVCQLEPHNLPAHLWLAQLCDFNHLPDHALKVVQDIRRQSEQFRVNRTNELQLAVVETAAYFQKGKIAQGVQLLHSEISRNPTNEAFSSTAVQFLRAKGLYTNALTVIDARLKDVPDDPHWLFEKGLIYLQLKDYAKAIPVLSRVLSVQADNSTARFDRAVAYLASDQLEKARADYEELDQTYTNSFRIQYGLGEIAWRQHRTNDAIRYYKSYLSNPHANPSEASNIAQRLHELEGNSH